MEDMGPYQKSGRHCLVGVGRSRKEEVVVVNPHCLLGGNQKMGEEGDLQAVLEVAANSIHHLEAVARIQSVFPVEVEKMQ